MELGRFLEDSPLSDRIKLDSRVVIHRTRMSHEELLAIKREGGFGPVKRKDTTCELVISGQILARGKIVKRGSGYYFKITEMDAGQTAMNANEAFNENRKEAENG
ncbi:MAG: hypothetical protein JW969_09790 [Spirochaetales bacterium]|nr:hypothetical protein [Spirochaetales bacterium]